ncbi:hypothetical protein KAI56_03055 [Candidatus Parcubacteria bacterium]|nr:hypothetical protein [Candidatus Parcubacteria bacterium]
MNDGKITKTFFIFLMLTLLGQSLVPFFGNKNAVAAIVSNISDTISDSRSSQFANHLISFRTVSSIDSGDTVIIKFDDTGNAFNLSSLSPVNISDYDFSVDGVDYDIVTVCADNNDLTISIDNIEDEITFTACAGNTITGGSDIRIEIGTNASFGGSGVNQIRNPSIGTSYFIDIDGTFGDTGRTVVVTTPSAGTSVSATVGGAIPSPPGGGGGGAITQTGNLKMIGKAYPVAFMTILKNGQVVGTQTADLNGNFEITIKSILANRIYDFGIFAQDNLGLLSPTLTYNLSINPNQITEVSNIYISPTIALSEKTISQGDSLRIYGSSYPNSLIVNFISPSFKATSLNSDDTGHWTYFFDSADYAAGEYFTKAKTIFMGGEQSEYSEELRFRIIKKSEPPIPPELPKPSEPQRKCNGANLNDDSKIDILDFSILLHYWKSKNPSNRCADINQNGIVDIYDFSIMMYYWTE